VLQEVELASESQPSMSPSYFSLLQEEPEVEIYPNPQICEIGGRFAEQTLEEVHVPAVVVQEYATLFD